MLDFVVNFQSNLNTFDGMILYIKFWLNVLKVSYLRVRTARILDVDYDL